MFDWFARYRRLHASDRQPPAGLTYASQASALAAAVFWVLMQESSRRGLSHSRCLDVELGIVRRLIATGEFGRGIAAFMRKERPSFEHGTLADPRAPDALRAMASDWVAEAMAAPSVIPPAAIAD